MFSLDVVDTDLFLEMPVSTQNLYFHLSMRADDDWFISSPNKIMKMTNSSKNDMDILILKSFIIPFDSWICVIRHRRINNYLRWDRYTPTIHKEELSWLSLQDDMYSRNTAKDSLGIPHGIPECDTGKNSIDKNSKEESSKEKKKKEKILDFEEFKSKIDLSFYKEIYNEQDIAIEMKSCFDYHLEKNWWVIIATSAFNNRLKRSVKYWNIRNKTKETPKDNSHIEKLYNFDHLTWKI